MFNFFRKNKGEEKQHDTDSAAQNIPGGKMAWGAPVTSATMSRRDAERAQREQAEVDAKSRERRDAYRPTGTERTFTDSAGHPYTLRVEGLAAFETGNAAPATSTDNAVALMTPPAGAINVLAFYGTRQVGGARAWHDTAGAKAVVVEVLQVENGYGGRGIGGELLTEVERVARKVGATAVVCRVGGAEDGGNDPQAFYTALGYSPRNADMVKDRAAFAG